MAHKSYSSQKPAPAPKRGSRLPLYVLGGALVLIMIGLFALFRGAAAPASPVEVAGQPRLAVDREQVDFGKVPVDKLVRAEFQLSNTGDEALQLLSTPVVEVREGC